MGFNKIPIKILFLIFILALATICLYSFSGTILHSIGSFLIIDKKPAYSDALVVLNTGADYYPRMIEAAQLNLLGLTKEVVINGKRKTDILRKIELKGFTKYCPWYADSFQILELFGVPKRKIIPISAEDTCDTISEAEAVGPELIRRKLTK